MIKIGQILKAQGIKGEVKIRSFVKDVSVFNAGKQITLQNKSVYSIQSMRTDLFVYVKLSGIDTRNDAENLAGQEIFINKQDDVALKDFEYYISDLLNCEVFVDDKSIGKITHIGQYGTADVHTVLGADGVEIRYPFLKKLVENVDIDAKKITLNKAVFNEVSVYDD